MRRRMMMGKRLPYDAEIEYLQSSGTQYVNLGKTFNSTIDEVVIKFIPSNVGSDTPGIFGARSSASSINASIIALPTLSAVIMDCNNSNYATYRLTASTNIHNKTIECKLSLSERYIKIDDVIVASSTTTTNSFTTLVVYLFAVNGLPTRLPIQFVSLDWKRSGQPYMQLKSVRVGQVGYIYDKVSGELFGNAGTGQFILGQDK